MPTGLRFNCPSIASMSSLIRVSSKNLSCHAAVKTIVGAEGTPHAALALVPMRYIKVTG